MKRNHNRLHKSETVKLDCKRKNAECFNTALSPSDWPRIIKTYHPSVHTLTKEPKKKRTPKKVAPSDIILNSVIILAI